MRAWIAIFLVAFSKSLLGQNADTLKTQVLMEVVIEGVKTDGDTLQNFYRSNPTATTETLLSRMKGVSLISRGAYGQEPVLRGLSNGQVNVTIDGMKMFGACTDKMDPVTIYVEPSNLSMVQSILGPQGTEFGSTVGGTLNMKLAQPTVGRNKVFGVGGSDFQSSASSFNQYATLNVSRGMSAYRTSFVFRKSGNYHDGNGDEVLYSQYQKVNFSLSGKWTLAKYDTLQADVLLDKGTNIGFPVLPMDVGSAEAGIYSMTYRHVAPWFIFHKVSVKGYYNSIFHAMDDSKRSDVIMHMDMPGRSRTSGLFADADVHVFHEHQARMKIEYFRNELLGEMTMYPHEGNPMYMQTAPESSRQSFGLYLSQQYKIDSRNKFLFTFRGDQIFDHLNSGIGFDQLTVLYPGDFQQTSRLLKNFSFNYTRNFSPSVMLEASIGYGERMPTLNEKFGFYLFNRFDGYDYIGNPFIEPEQTINVEFSLNYLGSAMELQLTPFYQTIENYILGRIVPDMSTMTIGAKGVKAFGNFGRAGLTGVDVMLLAKPANGFQLITTVKYTYGSLVTGDAMPLIPPLKSVSSLRYQIKNFNVQGEWEFALAQNHVSALAGEQKTAAYSIANIRAGIKLGRHWNVNAGVENVFDTAYRQHLDWGNLLRPGRNLYANVNFTF
jgi:iron complex outermembrane recepter protein